MTKISNLKRFRDYILKHYLRKSDEVGVLITWYDVYGINRGKFMFEVPRSMIPGLSWEAYEFGVNTVIKTYKKDSVVLAFEV